MVRSFAVAVCVIALGLGGCAENGDDERAEGTSRTRTFVVPEDAQDAYCRAAGALALAPDQPLDEARTTYERAAEDLDQAREQITETTFADRAVKSSLGALVATVRSALIAIATGDDAGRKKHEASIERRLSEHTADCG